MQKLYADKITPAMIIVLSMTILAACKKADSLKVDAIVEQKTAILAALTEPAATWVDSWAASFLSTKVNGAVQSSPSFNNQTFRLNIFSKLGGTKVRVKLTNKFGTSNLTVGAVHIAL